MTPLHPPLLAPRTGGPKPAASVGAAAVVVHGELTLHAQHIAQLALVLSASHLCSYKGVLGSIPCCVHMKGPLWQGKTGPNLSKVILEYSECIISSRRF